MVLVSVPLQAILEDRWEPYVKRFILLAACTNPLPHQPSPCLSDKMFACCWCYNYQHLTFELFNSSRICSASSSHWCDYDHKFTGRLLLACTLTPLYTLVLPGNGAIFCDILSAASVTVDFQDFLMLQRVGKQCRYSLPHGLSRDTFSLDQCLHKMSL